jgi:hypothetical protein
MEWEPKVFGGSILSFAGLCSLACEPGPASSDEGGGSEDGGTECAAGGSSVAGPPTLVAAKLDEETVIRLTFSEPLGSLDEVDPAAFRISWAIAYDYGPSDQYTSYFDPMDILCLSSDFCTYDYVDVIDVACAPDDPAALLLSVDVFHPYICQFLIDPQGSSMLLAHFDADLTTVADREGEPLASISPEFVTVDSSYLEVDGLFPNYPMPIPIDCL